MFLTSMVHFLPLLLLISIKKILKIKKRWIVRKGLSDRRAEAIRNESKQHGNLRKSKQKARSVCMGCLKDNYI